MLAGERAILKSTHRAHPEPQRALEGHHRGLSPPPQGRRQRRLCCWGAGERGAQPRDAAGDLQGQGDKSGLLGTETQLKAGARAWPWQDHGSTLQPGFQPTLEQPMPAAGNVQLGFYCASPHRLYRGSGPATRANHVPFPPHVPSCPSAPSAPAPWESGPGDGTAAMPAWKRLWPLSPAGGLRRRPGGSAGLQEEPTLQPGRDPGWAALGCWPRPPGTLCVPGCAGGPAEGRTAAWCRGVLGGRWGGRGPS